MKTTVQFKAVAGLIALAAFLSSFATVPRSAVRDLATAMGAHSFQILLDDKQVTEQYVKSDMIAPKVLIDPAENHKQLVVKYNECGRTVSGRVLSVKDINDKTLKEFRFNGVTSGYKDAMMCNVKDIVALKQGSTNTLKLIYSSAEFPAGQQVATLVIGSKSTASR